MSINFVDGRTETIDLTEVESTKFKNLSVKAHKIPVAKVGMFRALVYKIRGKKPPFGIKTLRKKKESFELTYIMKSGKIHEVRLDVSEHKANVIHMAVRRAISRAKRHYTK